MFEFKVDFTKSVPHRYCPSAKEAGALYIQCLAQAPMDIEFLEVRTGIFQITVSNEADKKKLEGKKLSYDFGENNHTMNTANIPLILQEKRPFYKNPKWVSIDKMYDSALKYATHEQVDLFLSAFGTIIVPTQNKTDTNGFRTGKREARIDLTTDIERWQSVTMKVMIEDKEVDVTGKLNFFYKDQPYMCRECQEKHHSKCPQKITKELAEAQGEKARITQSKTLLIGDSNLRRVNEKAFYAKTDCATGAKIGHIANALSWVGTGEQENIIILAGQNNVTTDPKIDITEWEKQMKKEVKKLKPKLSKFKKSILVGVPPAPWCKKTEKTKVMRKKVNEELKQLTRDNLNISYIDIEQEDEDDEANWEDERHMTEKFTHYMLGKVTEKMFDIQGGSFFVKNIPWTSKVKYRGVNATYKLGCNDCTAMGHIEGSCNSAKQGNKRIRSTGGGDSPTAQKPKT